MCGLELLPKLTALVASIGRSHSNTGISVCPFSQSQLRYLSINNEKIVKTCLDDTSRPVSRSVGRFEREPDKGILLD